MTTRAPLGPAMPLALGFAALAALVLGLGGWAVNASIVSAVVAPGRIEVEQNRLAVQHPDGGLVAEVAVREGDQVAAGALLLRLDAPALASELVIVEGQLHDLSARRARLDAERDGADQIHLDPALVEAVRLRPEVAGVVEVQRRLFAARAESRAREVAQLGQRRAQIEIQIGGLAIQAAALASERALVARDLATQSRLVAAGLAEAARVTVLEREAARLDGRAGELAAAGAAAAERIAEIEIEVLRIGSRTREEALAELRELEFRELELAERRRALRLRLDRLEIRAPVAGTVYGLSVFGAGAVIDPAQPALYLVPRGRPLVIAARVAAVDVDRVFAGQSVTLHFPAARARSLPEIGGRITRLSADAFVDERTGQSFFRAEIVLAPEDQARLGDLALVPGMPVDAFIRTGSGSPLAYLIRPLAEYFSRAFREG